MNQKTRRSRAVGSMIGLAIGDAMGARTEFLTMAQIRRAYGKEGPRSLPSPARVTDDTQMALDVGEVLVGAFPITPRSCCRRLVNRFIAWAHTVETFRAPGLTCLRAIGALEHTSWERATDTGSKGCGANMRVTPLGLAQLPFQTMTGLAQLQSALTHAHPTALAASELTAYATQLFFEGERPVNVISILLEHCKEQRGRFRNDWLGVQLLEQPDWRAHNNISWMTVGWDECYEALTRVVHALAKRYRKSEDPCQLTGSGWVAEEALATALYCTARFYDEPIAAVQRAAFTSGDSDSIAALTGAFVGAAHGVGAWPRGWVNRVEYSERLRALGVALAG